MPFYPLFRIPVTMKILIVEDDFLSRKLLNTFLASYGEIDNARPTVGGRRRRTATGI